MTKGSLIGTALAAGLMAWPGVALAQNANTNAPSGNGNAWNSSGNGYSNQNQTWRGDVNRPEQGVRYGNIGQGGYTGMRTPIPSDNDNGNNGGNIPMRPSQRNPLLADNGDARASKVISTHVFNQHDRKLGSIDDILIGRNGVYAVISTGNTRVAVPFQALVFGDTSSNGNNELVLPDVTVAQLDAEPEFRYHATNHATYNNNKGRTWFGNNFKGGNTGLVRSGSVAHKSSPGGSAGGNNNPNNG